MKKILTLTLGAALLTILVACANVSEPAPEAMESSQPSAASMESPADATVMSESDAAMEHENLDMDIVDIAAADGRFSTLVAAVEAAGLVDTLKSEGPFTLFAPTDEAFAQLPEGTLDDLLADIPALTEVLLYHVVPGEVSAEEVVTLDSANTVLEEPLSIATKEDEVMVNSSKVIITDIEASNGIIHAIDGVLLPPVEEPSQDI